MYQIEFVFGCKLESLIVMVVVVYWEWPWYYRVRKCARTEFVGFAINFTTNIEFFKRPY